MKTSAFFESIYIPEQISYKWAKMTTEEKDAFRARPLKMETTGNGAADAFNKLGMAGAGSV